MRPIPDSERDPLDEDPIAGCRGMFNAIVVTGIVGLIIFLVWVFLH